MSNKCNWSLCSSCIVCSECVWADNVFGRAASIVIAVSLYLFTHVIVVSIWSLNSKENARMWFRAAQCIGEPQGGQAPFFGTKELETLRWSDDHNQMFCNICNTGVQPGTLYVHLFQTEAHKKGTAKVSKLDFDTWQSKLDYLKTRTHGGKECEHFHKAWVLSKGDPMLQARFDPQLSQPRQMPSSSHVRPGDEHHVGNQQAPSQSSGASATSEVKDN